MKKSFLFAAAAASLFAACTSDDFAGLAETTPVNPEGYAVSFDAYAGRTTRAGQTGVLSTTTLQKSQDEGGGFGVFAYYTDLKKYDQTYMPNFMYNQGVFYNGSQWEYSPVLYWPNEYGSTAQSDDEDKVSFFAYAPYVETESVAAGSVKGDASYGITGFSRNTKVGDPQVRYIASFDPAKSVDLCWGVCDDESWKRIEGGSQTFTPGLPWIDVEHPEATNQRMKFNFKHALAQLNVQIDAVVDDDASLDASTKIWVRSISFTGIATQGSLNLNNLKADQALWLDYSGTTDLPYGESVTVKDGRRDGREGANGAEANNELPQDLNPQLVQMYGVSHSGVTSTPQNLFNSSIAAQPVCVIPTGEALTMTIVYDIETVSPNLPGYISDGTTHGVSIENRITKTINFGTSTAGLQNGKKYTVNLHLGMNSAKFDAEVTDWVVEETATMGDGSKVTTYTNDDGKIVYMAADVKSQAVLQDIISNTTNAEEVAITLPSGSFEPKIYKSGSLGMESLTITGDGTTQLAFQDLQVMASLVDELVIENCEIMHMATKSWGHIVFGGSGKADGVYTVRNCTFNGVGTQGIYINETATGATYNIEGCTFDGDFGGEGAITIQNNANVNHSVNIKNCTFSNIPDTSHKVFIIYDYYGWTLNLENNTGLSSSDVCWKHDPNP